MVLRIRSDVRIALVVTVDSWTLRYMQRKEFF